MNIKYLNESFKRLYEEAIDYEPAESSFEHQLRKQLTIAKIRLQSSGATNIKEYEIAFQQAIEDVEPDKAWWEVTDCNIFFNLFETRSPELTIEQILAELKPEYKQIEESLNEDLIFDQGDDYIILKPIGKLAGLIKSGKVDIDELKEFLTDFDDWTNLVGFTTSEENNTIYCDEFNVDDIDSIIELFKNYCDALYQDCVDYVDESLNENVNKWLDAINSVLNDEQASKIVYNWYNNEGAFDDFESTEDFIDYLKDDIYDMLDAATTQNEKDVVMKALGDDDFYESLQECLNKLNEAQISDEDQRDSDHIRSMLDKISKRKNARFSPEEQAVLDKYGLERVTWGNERNLTKNDVPLDAPEDDRHARYSSYAYNNGNRDKINYADRARKIPTRRDNQVYGSEAGKLYRSSGNGYVNMHGFNHSLQDAERNFRNATMYEPVADMKQALSDRKYNKKYMDSAQSDYDAAIEKAKKAYDDAVRRAESNREQATTGYHKIGFDRAQRNIDKLLKRKPKED